MAMQSLLTMIKVSVFGKWTERTFFSDLKKNPYTTYPNVHSVKYLYEKVLIEYTK